MKSLHELCFVQQNDFAEDLKFRVAMQCCAGLHHLHARFIVHQDIKPANILVSKRFPDQAQIQDLVCLSMHKQENRSVISRSPNSEFLLLIG